MGGMWKATTLNGVLIVVLRGLHAVAFTFGLTTT